MELSGKGGSTLALPPLTYSEMCIAGSSGRLTSTRIPRTHAANMNRMNSIQYMIIIVRRKKDEFTQYRYPVIDLIIIAYIFKRK